MYLCCAMYSLAPAAPVAQSSVSPGSKPHGTAYTVIQHRLQWVQKITDVLLSETHTNKRVPRNPCVTCQQRIRRGNFLSYQREITLKILIAELWPLFVSLPCIKIFPSMKFHCNSISRTGVIAKRKSVTEKA